jgi:hypothetical protein
VAALVSLAIASAERRGVISPEDAADIREAKTILAAEITALAAAADETPQQCLDRHTLAMVEGWVETDVGTQARELYARLLAAPANVRDAIFAQANQALG